jgi:hypothetical protein
MCAGKFGVYLGCDGGIDKQVHAFTLFEVCTHAPYVRRCNKVPLDKLKATELGYAYGHCAYFSKIMEGQPATLSGPFTIGVCWEKKR